MVQDLNTEVLEKEIDVVDINEVEVETIVKEEPIVVKGGKVYAFFKRAFDIVSSFMVILVLIVIPVLPILAIIVKLTSKGPILFKDRRVGKDGKEIKVYKFRTMFVDAEQRIKDYLTEEQYQTWLVERKIENDPRITKIGKFLRKTSLDELPQLFNVLFGSLSVVGPRPIAKIEMDLNYTENQRKAMISIKPGITGYWQVYGRSDVDYASGERQKLELEYLNKRGFWFDIKLIFMTIPRVLSSKGAK